MQVFKNIVCPVDFSPASGKAYQYAQAFSEIVKGDLTLLHVVPNVSETYHALMPDFPALTVPKVENILYRFKEFTSDWTGKLKKELRPGTPYHEILKYAEEENTDLIILGAKGVSRMDRLFLGTTAERVVRHATCPVLTVHDKEQNLPIQKILVPVDFSHTSDEILPIVAELTKLCDAKLFLLHIVEIGQHFDSEAQQREYARFREMKEKLERVWPTPDMLNKIEVKKVVRHHIGSPGYGIIQFAQDWDIDLIMMTTQGRTGFAKMLLGSVAEKVIRIAPCPVLSLKSGVKANPDGNAIHQKPEPLRQ